MFNDGSLVTIAQMQEVAPRSRNAPRTSMLTCCCWLTMMFVPPRNTANMKEMRRECQEDTGSVRKVDFPFRCNESVESMESNTKAQHRSMWSGPSEGDVQDLIIIKHLPDPRLSRRMTSMCSLQPFLSFQSTSSMGRMTELPSCDSTIDFANDDDWGHFVDFTPPAQRQSFLKHETIFSKDARFKLLKHQQIIHML